MRFSGLSPDGRLVEIAEVEGHPWMVGSQFHPEFRSRPYRPHPLFRGFIGACLARVPRAAAQDEEVTKQPSRKLRVDRPSENGEPVEAVEEARS